MAAFEGGAVDEALKAKGEGLIKHLAVSSHLQGDQIREILAEGPLEGVTLGYSAINFPYRQAAIDAAGEMGLGVVTMNPLGGGLIPNNAEKFDFIRTEADESVVAAALRFNISQAPVSSARTSVPRRGRTTSPASSEWATNTCLYGKVCPAARAPVRSNRSGGSSDRLGRW